MEIYLFWIGCEPRHNRMGFVLRGAYGEHPITMYNTGGVAGMSDKSGVFCHVL
jgi:hypothetical protein